MAYKMKKQRPVRRGRLFTPKQIEDVKLVVGAICAINNEHLDGGEGAEVLEEPKRWKPVHDAALRLRTLWKRVVR